VAEYARVERAAGPLVFHYWELCLQVVGDETKFLDPSYAGLLIDSLLFIRTFDSK